jgi:ABC-2 type transport system permease protein
MSHLISAEFLKLRTTRTAVALVGAAIAVVVLISAVATFTGDFDEGDFVATDLLGITFFAQIVALVLGVLAVTTEFRHGTITPTLVAQPSRVRMVLSKLVANMVAGFLLGAVAVGLCSAIVLIGLNARDIPTGIDSSDTVQVIVGQTISGGLFAAIGVGFGAIVRNQVGTIVGALIWVFVGESLLTLIPSVGDAVQKYGLGGVSNGLQHLETQNTGDVLGQVPAGLLMAGYAAVLVIVGLLVIRNRDVTS